MRWGCVNLHETASATTWKVLLHDMKCVIYTTHGHGCIWRNLQESLHKPHDDNVAQVTVYETALYFQFVLSIAGIATPDDSKQQAKYIAYTCLARADLVSTLSGRALL